MRKIRILALCTPIITSLLVTACDVPEAITTQSGARSFERSLALEDAAYTSANVSLGDVNGDGHLDVILVKGRHWPLQNQLRLGDGKGGFATPIPVGPGPDRSYTGELVDLDDDGDLDMIVSNDSPDPKRVLHNDGSGNFTEVQQFGTPDWNTRHVSVADLNGDGRADVIAANRGGPAGTENFVCFGAGGGLLQQPCTVVYRGSATTITPADMDGDGDLDLVIPHRDGGQSELLLNNGAGVFADGKVFGPRSVGYRSAAVADFDKDGFMDVAIIAPGSRTGIETQGPDGGSGVVARPRRGVFYGGPDLDFGKLKALRESSERPYAILAADVDADGRTDLIVGHVEARPVVWFNEGSRNFTPVSFGDDEGTAYGFAVNDLNGDGLMDIVVARSGAPNIIYFGSAE
ncbi:VCBS repeat-containing protein [Congregibacter variabilis]|uniref:VCBS repeat-containing protein n=1 Tax=Congregibacter variabilis TaxID=3081200 RepID=A0ABZ0I225_9GAMM|nr:VCBS repeat-containing protein [Congregibacter sp. IMCC43200]